jgi:hypothetical protein
MHYGVFGTGVVGQTLATALVTLGHTVTMGGRTAHGDAATAWVASASARVASGGGPPGGNALEGTFADAARSGEVLVNATNGAHALEALALVAEADLDGKVLIDVSNPLDFSRGMPPTLTVCNTDSLGEQIQRAHPTARVVKTLNTVNADVMVDPAIVPGAHTIFVCGDDAGAKETATSVLVELGWRRDAVLDLGGITACRGVEMYLPLWVAMRQAAGTGHLNIRVVTE